MPITPADALDLQIAKGPPSAEGFAKLIAGLPGAYYAGLDEAYKRRTQDAFQGGYPTIDVKGADGKTVSVPDFGAMTDTTLRAGGIPAIPSAVSLSNLDLARQKLIYGQRINEEVNPPSVPGAPPSTASTSVAAPALRPTSGPPGSSNGMSPTSVNAAISQAGFSGADAGSLMTRIAQGLGVDPDQNLDPVKQAQVATAVQRAVQARQQTQSTAAPPQAPQAPQAVPSSAPNVVPSAGGGPNPGGRTDIQQLTLINRALGSGMLEPDQAKSLQAQADSIYKRMELTIGGKDYRDYVEQTLKSGQIPLGRDQWETENAGSQARAKAGAEAFVKRYETITDTGSKALQEIPQLQLAQKLMDDPNFFSGAGEKYNLALKRVAVALGADPNTAAPQEAFRKIVSGSILQGLKGLQGVGQIRVAEINLLKQAAASNENTPAANRILLTSAQRLNERNAAVAGMAQNYKGGNIDSGFDRQVAEYDRAHPLFSDGEINNFRNIISGAKGAPTVSNGATATNPKTGERLIFRNGKWEPHA